MAIETAVMQLDAQIARLGRWPNQDCARRTADLVVLARRCAAAYRQPGQYDRIRVEASAAQVLGAWDAIGLACALDNLLSNAVKYSPDGEAIAIQIRTEQDADGPWAIACVCDRGIGIPADALSKIFTPYYRAANVPPAVAGTGLGLASVRRLIAAEGGTVSVRSRVGAG